MSRNLRLRVLTAVIGVPVILAFLLFMGIGGVAFLAWVISTGMLFEYCRMCFRLKDARQKTMIALVANGLIHGLNHVVSASLSLAFLSTAPVLVFFSFFLFMVPPLLNHGDSAVAESPEGIAILRQHVQELMALCFGVAYCIVLPLFMVGIRELPFGEHWLTLTLVVIWASDTFAYFAGLSFGRRKLYELISPKKTWEGALGGAVGAVLIGLAYGALFLPRVPWGVIAVLAVVLSVVGAVGDLAESLLKRATACKDSGSILPGHGGFLDRFDGVVFALPVMYLFLVLYYH
jgi:phosphatidate cytidylyltransferase